MDKALPDACFTHVQHAAPRIWVAIHIPRMKKTFSSLSCIHQSNRFQLLEYRSESWRLTDCSTSEQVSPDRTDRNNAHVFDRVDENQLPHARSQHSAIASEKQRFLLQETRTPLPYHYLRPWRTTPPQFSNRDYDDQCATTPPHSAVRSPADTHSNAAADEPSTTNREANSSDCSKRQTVFEQTSCTKNWSISLFISDWMA